MADAKSLKRKAPEPESTPSFGPVSELYHKDQNTEKWLVKVPAFVYESWMGLTQDTVVGRINVVPNESGSDLTLQLDGESVDYHGAPLQYELHDTARGKPMKPSASVIMVEDAFTGKVNLDGRISKNVDMEAVDKAAVLKYTLNRTKSVKDAAKDKSTSVHIEPLHDSAVKGGVFKNRITGIVKERDQLGNVEKNFRVSEDELEKMIIEAYREKTEYTFKDLNAKLKQPEQFLKEQLGKYCVAVKREGGQGNKWVLRSDLASVITMNKKVKTEDGQSPNKAPGGAK